MSKSNEVTVKMIDALPDCVDAAIDGIKDQLQFYFSENKDDDFPDWGDVDYSGRLHEIVDGAVPVYHSEIRDAWYLHGDRIEEAYENMGIGDNPRENDGLTALFCYIEQQCQEWWHDNAEDLWDEFCAEDLKAEKATGGQNK